MSDEDFCLEHGRDFMRCDKGPIAYCKKCDEQFSCDTTPCVHKAMTGERCKGKCLNPRDCSGTPD